MTSSLSDTHITPARCFAWGCACSKGYLVLTAVLVPVEAPPAVHEPQPSPAVRTLLFWSPDWTQETFALFLPTLMKNLLLTAP